MTRSPSFVCFLAVFAATAASVPDTPLEQGYNDMYNLHFNQAHRTFTSYEATRPDDPLGPVSDAAACLFSEFNHLHILESEFFLNDKNVTNSDKTQPDPVVRARFDKDLEKAQRLAASEMQLPAQRANGMFADALRLGLQADYLALIDKRDVAALSEMKKARETAEQLLSEHPTYYDAYIAVGAENYLLSLKPAPLRWMLRLGGAETDKDNGLEKLRLTADHGHYLMPYARLLLAVAALRDGHKDQARDLLTWLATHYPHNNLYREELAKLQ